MTSATQDAVFRALMLEPAGLSAPEILRRLRHRISQPTLWRALDQLRAEGRICVEGRARATRYRVAGALDAAALRSLHMHRAVARRLARDPELLAEARVRLEVLGNVNPHGRAYHDRWSSLVDGPLERLLSAMTEDSEQARTMRQESPFTTLVTSSERQRAFAAVR